jgi:sulfonate transport system substrate-binding protein
MDGAKTVNGLDVPATRSGKTREVIMCSAAKWYRSFSYVVSALLLGLVSTIAVIGVFASPDKAISELRIGYQKGSSLMVLKSTGDLDRRLDPLGVKIRWSEFPSGPPLLEALNAGELDFGIAGNAATVFAQAATDSQLVYLAAEAPSPHADGIVVRKDSPARTLQDLKGKTIAFTHGSNAHYFLIKALQKAHLSLDDIKQADLSPTDARAAFENGSVDAWVIWDPFYAEAEVNLGARLLTDAVGIVDDSIIYSSLRPVAQQHSDLFHAVIEEIGKTDGWIRTHPELAAAQLSTETGVPFAIWQKAISRRDYRVIPIDRQLFVKQQAIADVFYSLGLLPTPEKVASAALTNSSR